MFDVLRGRYISGSNKWKWKDIKQSVMCDT